MNCKHIKAAIDSASRRNPINGDAHAHLSGCPDCRSYSDQSSSLLSMLAAQPRIQAPADFDFRLRARIARAEAQPVSPFAVVENLFGRVFSLKQAATSLAALAIMAAGTTFYFNQSGQPVITSPMVASNTVQTVRTIQPELPVSASAPMTRTAVKAQSNAASFKTVAWVRASAETEMPTSNYKVRVYNSAKGHVSELATGGVVYGAESSAQLARPASFGSF
ncbi:MAG: anti-sigma factor family protein [Blastocatellia bacterium]